MAMGRVLRSSWQRGRRFTLRVFGAAMLISLVIVGLQVHWQVQSEHSRMELIADEYMNYSQLMLADIEQNAQYAGALVVRQNGQVGDFSEAARNIVQNDTAVQRAALAPQGILQPGYPLNDADGGRRILEDASWGAAARWSRDNGRMVIVSGGDSSLRTALWPVYLNQAGGRTFWGFVVLEFLPQDFMQQAGRENESSHPAAYEVSCAEPWQGSEQLLVRSSEALLASPVERNAVGGSNRLHLKLSPIGSWIDFVLVGELLFLSLFVSSMIAGVALLFYELHQEKREFAQQAFTDELTGLWNRRRFTMLLKEACRAKEPFLLCYIDIDHFKAVNDTYGHDIGDLLLQAAGKRLTESLGPEDMLFRIGGDEFVAFLDDPGSDEERQRRMAVFQEKMKKPFKLDGIILDMNISTGYVLYPRDAGDSETLLRMADQRMYEQKQRRR